MPTTAKRLDYLDAAKGLGVLLVIYGHTFRDSMRAAYAWCDLSYILVYRFHVSLLFLLSGMGYALTAKANASLSAGQYLRKKANSLLRPWLSYSLLVYAVFTLVQCIPAYRALLASTSYGLLSPLNYAWAMLCNENPYSFHLWYLQTLFLFVAVTFLLDRFLPPRTARRVKLALLVFLPGFYAVFCTQWVWTFKAFFQKYYCFLLGALLPPETAEQKAKPLAVLGLGCGAFILLELFFPPTALYAAPVSNFLLAYVDAAAVAGLCLGLLAACILLRQFLQPLARFGRRSMLFYLYHQPFCALLGMILYDKLHLPAGGTVLACMAASLLVPCAAHCLAHHTGLHRLLDKAGLPA